MTTLGFPPYFQSLAFMSPKVLVTDSRPGSTRNGPLLCSFNSLVSMSNTSPFVQNIFPPFYTILCCYLESVGLWSLDRLKICLPLQADITHLLSPTLAVKHCLPTISTTLAQEPLLSDPELQHCAKKSYQHYLKPFLIASLGSLGKQACFITYWCSLSLRKSEQPAPPCPSYTPKNEQEGQNQEALFQGLMTFKIIETRSQLQFLQLPVVVLAAQASTEPMPLHEILLFQYFRLFFSYFLLFIRSSLFSDSSRRHASFKAFPHNATDRYFYSVFSEIFMSYSKSQTQTAGLAILTSGLIFLARSGLSWFSFSL